MHEFCNHDTTFLFCDTHTGRALYVAYIVAVNAVLLKVNFKTFMLYTVIVCCSV